MYYDNPLPIYIIQLILVLIAVEACVIKLSSKIRLLKALGAATLVNLVAAAIDIGTWELARNFPDPDNFWVFRQIGFGISILVAIAINVRILERQTPLKLMLLPSIGMTVLVYLGIYMLLMNSLGARHPAWMSRAKGTLRSIGSAELSYQNENKVKLYGSFKALQDSQDIAHGYTLGNMIENYSMAWNVSYAPTTVSDECPSGITSTFAVVALPVDGGRSHLQTFAVTEDQVVRVFNPKNKNKVHDVKSWDPIL